MIIITNDYLLTSGFIGGNKTKEGALQMAKKALIL